MPMPQFTYVRPKSLQEAVKQVSSKGARIHAGGTDLLGCLRDEILEASKVVSLRQVRELRGLQSTKEGGLRIGALTTITEVAQSQIIKERYPALAQAASEVASPQLRNQGTLGGNLCQKPRCWYYRGEFHCRRKGGDQCFAYEGENAYHCIFGGNMCYIVHPSDTAPALLAYDAKIRIVGPQGPRTVPLAMFYILPKEDVKRETILKPNEIVTEVLLPAAWKGSPATYRKVRARRSWDFAIAGVALALRFRGEKVEKARVVLSGAAPVPWRTKEVEEAITGRQLDAETVSLAAQAAVRKAEPLKQNAYKIPLFRAIVEEELIKIAKG